MSAQHHPLDERTSWVISKDSDVNFPIEMRGRDTTWIALASRDSEMLPIAQR
jgi:hypothetical protein